MGFIKATKLERQASDNEEELRRQQLEKQMRTARLKEVRQYENSVSNRIAQINRLNKNEKTANSKVDLLAKRKEEIIEQLENLKKQKIQDRVNHQTKAEQAERLNEYRARKAEEQRLKKIQFDKDTKTRAAAALEAIETARRENEETRRLAAIEAAKIEATEISKQWVKDEYELRPPPPPAAPPAPVTKPIMINNNHKNGLFDFTTIQTNCHRHSDDSAIFATTLNEPATQPQEGLTETQAIAAKQRHNDALQRLDAEKATLREEQNRTERKKIEKYMKVQSVVLDQQECKENMVEMSFNMSCTESAKNLKWKGKPDPLPEEVIDTRPPWNNAATSKPGATTHHIPQPGIEDAELRILRPIMQPSIRAQRTESTREPTGESRIPRPSRSSSINSADLPNLVRPVKQSKAKTKPVPEPASDTSSSYIMTDTSNSEVYGVDVLPTICEGDEQELTISSIISSEDIVEEAEKFAQSIEADHSQSNLADKIIKLERMNEKEDKKHDDLSLVSWPSSTELNNEQQQSTSNINIGVSPKNDDTIFCDESSFAGYLFFKKSKFFGFQPMQFIFGMRSSTAPPVPQLNPSRASGSKQPPKENSLEAATQMLNQRFKKFGVDPNISSAHDASASEYFMQTQSSQHSSSHGDKTRSESLNDSVLSLSDGGTSLSHDVSPFFARNAVRIPQPEPLDVSPVQKPRYFGGTGMSRYDETMMHRLDDMVESLDGKIQELHERN